jgi:hypothetical protein
MSEDNLYSLAKTLTEQFMPCNMKIGEITTHPDGRKVKIISGQYWGTYGLSNFWYWREVLQDGTLSEKIEHGYGW